MAQGHISFRTDPLVHQQLQMIAEVLGLDMSALINQIIAKALPEEIDRVTQLVKAKQKAIGKLLECVWEEQTSPGGKSE